MDIEEKEAEPEIARTEKEEIDATRPSGDEKREEWPRSCNEKELLVIILVLSKEKPRKRNISGRKRNIAGRRERHIPPSFGRRSPPFGTELKTRSEENEVDRRREISRDGLRRTSYE